MRDNFQQPFLWLLDNSAKKLQCALLLKFESH